MGQSMWLLLGVTAQFANGCEVLNVVGVDIGSNGEVLRNPPEQDLDICQSQRLHRGLRLDTLPSSDPEAIKSSLKGFLKWVGW